MKKLLLIHPSTRSGAAGFAQGAAWHMPPLALGYIAALTPDNWDIKIVDEYVNLLDPDEQADLVGITSYTANATRAYHLASIFRKQGIPVVMGGIHASMCPDEASQYVDTVVTGEAEPVWNKLIADFEAGKLQTRYSGERRPLHNLPIPRRDLFSDTYDMDVITTSRGCPFGCEFCSVTAFNGREYRQRPINEVLDEMQTLKKDVIYIVDDNILGFGTEAKERAINLFDGIITRKIKKFWGTQASFNIADDDEILAHAYKSGCRLIYIGMESIVAENLKQMQKGLNFKIGIDGYKDRIRRIHKHGIAVIGSFVLGHDYDNISVAKQTLDFMNETNLDVFQLSYLTPLPGTKLYDRIRHEGRMIYDNFPDDWDYCDTDNIMIRPKNMSIVELVHGFDYIAQHRLSKAKIVWQSLKTLFNTRNLISTLLAYNMNKGSWEALNPEKEIKQLAKSMKSQGQESQKHV